MFDSVLIANRGEIALRVIRTCKELGIRSIVAHSTADAGSLAVRYADDAVQVGPAPSRHSYLNAAAVITAALQSGADAVHPGYGFLSEDPDFAEACDAYGLTFIGPRPEVMARLGDKAQARAAAVGSGLPVLPGSTGALESGTEAKEAADEIGYPVIIKAVAGGGGRGMTVVREPQDFLHSYARTRAVAQAVFGDGRVYVEKYVDGARHVEVQVLGDSHGNVVHLGARDCSVQRRRQKLIEETPPPGLPDSMVAEMGAAAVRSAAQLGYTGAGTYEFVVDDAYNFYLMEINCRIQVEHPVTEVVTGVDLVREQILAAAGHRLGLRQQDICTRGVAIECRVNTEDPARGFLPTSGELTEFAPPSGPFVRVDTHGFRGMRVSPDYDSLLAKVIVWAPERAQAITRMDRALEEFVVAGRGVHTTIPFLRDVLAHPLFAHAKHTTSLVDVMG